MAQNRHVAGGHNDANAPALPTASILRVYVWNDRGHDPQHLHVQVRLHYECIPKPLLIKLRVRTRSSDESLI